jgi:hypothetical protein
MNATRISLLSIVGVVVFIGSIFVIAFSVQSYGRWNRLQDERNQVQVNDIQIQQTAQLVNVEKQKAQIKIQEALGIAKAQEIINGTLTPQYLQHEAIQAQLEAAGNSSHTETIYIPSGAQGIPLVATMSARGGTVSK